MVNSKSGFGLWSLSRNLFIHMLVYIRTVRASSCGDEAGPNIALSVLVYMSRTMLSTNLMQACLRS